MKIVECADLAGVNALLRSVKVNDTKISGSLEVYSCKSYDSIDKKVSKEVEQRFTEEMSNSPHIKSAIGNMADAKKRKLFVHLITTLNAAFPDYDYSSLTPDDFTQETNMTNVVNNINAALAEVADFYSSEDLLSQLWLALKAAIDPETCDVYSYVPEDECDPQVEGKLWSFNFFFHNKHVGHILFFHCHAARRSTLHHSDSDESDDWMDTGSEF